ncbi:GDSL esterase/lipase 2 isoform X1 [Ricinus communis]|uniref:Zinc finger protein, putative n=1 Tax=Ricinus communis TaxID=3988 RepID=B9T4S3_RICCO|nr:GDSL esterase/lipase 2 isoform X1 [Ricinus communis]EEF29143.1 zinc finger protein, putative [Ricinus communis]|eukprot:XP_002533242.1 GDSL esterase/lipase 2 isoform X1 [Ricinus communis]
MSSIRFQVYFLLALCAVLVIPKSTKAHPHPEEFQNHVALFVFGDSLFDVGNNNYLKNPIGLANFWPYGETFFNHPTGRFCDGRLISDFLAEYLKLPLILPYLQPGVHQFTNGVNFASGGAGALVETHEGRVVDLKTQVLYLKNVKKQISKQIGDEETKTLLSKAIYLISIGGNEYLAPSHVFKSFSREDYVRMVIGNLTSVIKDIYKIGGRKFVFVGMGSFDCSPNIKLLNQEKGSCNKEMTALLKIHNTELPNTLEEIQDQLKEFQYVFFDFYNTLLERINNPSKFGFKEANVACCGAGLYRGILSSCGLVKGYEVCDDVSDYVFFDSVHSTEKTYKQLAKLIWTGGHNVSKPCNLKTMVEA